MCTVGSTVKAVNERRINYGKEKICTGGLGGRATFFYHAVATRFSETSEITAFCDVNRTRLEYAKSRMQDEFGYKGDIALYGADYLGWVVLLFII